MDLLGDTSEDALPTRLFHWAFVSKPINGRRPMASSIKTWVMKIKPGRIDDAMELFRESKKSANGAEISLLYAESAGDFSGSFLLSAQYPSAAAAGEAEDKSSSTEAGQALWRKFNAADSPVEATATVTYTGVDL